MHGDSTQAPFTQAGFTIDCDTCAVRDLQCGDCVMTVLLGARGSYQVDAGEALALEALADGGLVPHLRLVPLGLPPAQAS